MLVQTPVSETGMQRFESFLHSHYGDVRLTARHRAVTAETPGQHWHALPMSHRPISEAHVCKTWRSGCNSHVRLHMEGQADGRRHLSATEASDEPCAFNSRTFRQWNVPLNGGQLVLKTRAWAVTGVRFLYVPPTWVASSNRKTPVLQAGNPGATPGRSTSGSVG